MTVNEGIPDRIIRLLVAVLILLLFFLGALPGYWAIFLFFSGILFVTAITGSCLLYKILGINTGKKAQ